MKDKLAFLKGLKARLSLLHAGTRQNLTEFFDKAIETCGSTEHRDKLTALQSSALTDKSAMRQLNKLRVITIQNFVTALANAAAFFETTDLLEDEEPFVENNTRQEVRARFIGEDGAPHMTQAIRSRSTSRIDLRTLSTDKVEYPLVDVYKGRVAEQALANIDLSYDLSMKKNAELWALVQVAVGAFSLSGSKQDRVYVPHSTIKAGNLPTTNLVTLSGNTVSTKFRFDVIRAALQWCLSWGNNSTSFGDIVPVTFYLPSTDIGGMLDEINMNSPDNALVNEIADTGYVLKLGGKQFNVIGDATLDPAAGLCYVRTNVPLGKHLPKPSMGVSYPESPDQISDEQRQANKGTTWMKEVYGAFIPNSTRMGVLGVRYRTAQ